MIQEVNEIGMEIRNVSETVVLHKLQELGIKLQNDFFL